MFKYVKFEKVKTENTVLEFRGESEDVKVNHFDVDVVSIEAEDESLIDALIDSQPSDIGCESIEQDEFISIIENSSRYARVLNKTEEYYASNMKIITSKYPQIERETWATQLEQAIKYKDSSDEDDAPFLKVLADADGVSVDEMADAVISKADDYASYSANALADKRAFKRSLLSEFGA